MDATTDIKVALRLAGTPIGPIDTAIAGHTIAAGAVLVTNNGGGVCAGAGPGAGRLGQLVSLRSNPAILRCDSCGVNFF